MPFRVWGPPYSKEYGGALFIWGPPYSKEYGGALFIWGPPYSLEYGGAPFKAISWGGPGVVFKGGVIIYPPGVALSLFSDQAYNP